MKWWRWMLVCLMLTAIAFVGVVALPSLGAMVSAAPSSVFGSSAGAATASWPCEASPAGATTSGAGTGSG